MKKTILLAGLTAVAFSVSSPALADRGNGSWWSSWFNSSPKKNEDVILSNNFTAEEKTIIRTVFEELFPEATDSDSEKSSKGSKSMPHGLAKRDRLPPGLEKQIQEKGTLPPGLAKRDLPDELVRRLPKRGKGQEIVWVDDDIYLIETATRVVLDVVRDVLK